MTARMTTARMTTARPFRYLVPVLAFVLAPALAALGLLALRLASPSSGPAAAPAAGDGRVVFRHYL